jgi:hypothetical protein
MALLLLRLSVLVMKSAKVGSMHMVFQRLARRGSWERMGSSQVWLLSGALQ